MAKFEDIHGLFKYIKKQIFMKDYSEVNPNSGFNHRFSRQKVGGKVLDLNDDDKEVVADALDIFIQDCSRVRDGLRKGKF